MTNSSQTDKPRSIAECLEVINRIANSPPRNYDSVRENLREVKAGVEKIDKAIKKARRCGM